jgi:hypothetical protein
MTSSIRSVVLVAVVTSSFAFAQAPTVKPPSADAIRDTWNFFQNGKGQGLVLVDLKLCTDIAKDGPNKFECATEIGADGVKAGTNVNVWQAYLLPQGDLIEDLTVQLKQGNTVRETKDVKVKGESWRTRTWTGVRIAKPGEWTISVMRGEQLLKEVKLTAK